MIAGNVLWSVAHSPSVVQKQEERAGDEDRLGVVGDKQGCVGQLVVGDTTGSFYVLNLQDVAQKAEALRHVELQAWGGRLKVELASAAEVEVDDTVAVDPDAKQPEEAVVVEAPIEKVNYNELLNRTLLWYKTAVCTLTHDVSDQATCWRFRTVTSRNGWWCRIAWTQASRQTWTWHEQRCPSLASMWSTWGSSNTSPTASAVCFLSGTWHRMKIDGQGVFVTTRRSWHRYQEVSPDVEFAGALSLLPADMQAVVREEMEAETKARRIAAAAASPAASSASIATAAGSSKSLASPGVKHASGSTRAMRKKAKSKGRGLRISVGSNDNQGSKLSTGRITSKPGTKSTRRPPKSTRSTRRTVDSLTPKDSRVFFPSKPSPDRGTSGGHQRKASSGSTRTHQRKVSSDSSARQQGRRISAASTVQSQRGSEIVSDGYTSDSYVDTDDGAGESETAKAIAKVRTRHLRVVTPSVARLTRLCSRSGSARRRCWGYLVVLAVCTTCWCRTCEPCCPTRP